MDTTMKRCANSKCEQENPQPVYEFNKDKARKDGLQSYCKSCLGSYRQANKEKKLQYQKQYDQSHKQNRELYYQANKNRILEYGRTYRASHKEKIKLRYRGRYQSKNKERLSAYRRANREKLIEYRRRNRDKIRENTRRFREENPGIVVVYNNARRARKADNGGDYKIDEWLSLCEKYDNRCLACGEQKPLTVDHVIPISKGGKNDISNLQPLCKNCNSIKGTKVIDYR